MGKKGFKSKRGVGEKDATVRNQRISLWATEADLILINKLCQKLGKSKTDLLILLIRNADKYLDKLLD